MNAIIKPLSNTLSTLKYSLTHYIDVERKGAGKWISHKPRKTQGTDRVYTPCVHFKGVTYHFDFHKSPVGRVSLYTT